MAERMGKHQPDTPEKPKAYDVDDQGNVTEKGIVRSLLFMLALIIGTADQENRQLLEEDVITIKRIMFLTRNELDDVRASDALVRVTGQSAPTEQGDAPGPPQPLIPGTNIVVPPTFGGG